MLSYFQRRRRRAHKNDSTNTASTETRTSSGVTFKKPPYLQPSSEMRPRTETKMSQHTLNTQKPLPPLPLNAAGPLWHPKPHWDLCSLTAKEFWDLLESETHEQRPPIHLYPTPASLNDRITTEEASRIALSHKFDVVFVASLDLSGLQQYSPHNLCAYLLVAHGLELPSDSNPHLLVPTEMYANFVSKSTLSMNLHDPSSLPSGYETGASLILNAGSREAGKPAVIFSCLSQSRAAASIDQERLLRDAKGLKTLLDLNWSRDCIGWLEQFSKGACC